MDWHFSVNEIIAGAIGGLCYAIFKDEIVLPYRKGLRLYLGCFRAIILGAFVAFLVDTHPVLSALMGFSFNDVIVSLQRRVQKWIQETEAHRNLQGGENVAEQDV